MVTALSEGGAAESAMGLERDLLAPVVFDVYVKNYQQTSGGFRQFIGSADLNLYDLGITEFVGYDPNLKLVFSFQAFSKSK